MTKKMQKIIKTYEERLDTAVYTYEKGFCTYEEAREELRTEENRLTEMMTSMYFYSLLSDTDFRDGYPLKTEIYLKYMEKLIDLKYDR